MKTEAFIFRLSFPDSSKVTNEALSLILFYMLMMICERNVRIIGDNLLNSSKTTQAPYAQIPLKNLIMLSNSTWPEAFYTKHNFARALPRSLVVSVLPVPKGPSGAPPYAY